MLSLSGELGDVIKARIEQATAAEINKLECPLRAGGTRRRSRDRLGHVSHIPLHGLDGRCRAWLRCRRSTIPSLRSPGTVAPLPLSSALPAAQWIRRYRTVDMGGTPLAGKLLEKGDQEDRHAGQDDEEGEHRQGQGGGRTLRLWPGSGMRRSSGWSRRRVRGWGSADDPTTSSVRRPNRCCWPSTGAAGSGGLCPPPVPGWLLGEFLVTGAVAAV